MRLRYLVYCFIDYFFWKERSIKLFNQNCLCMRDMNGIVTYDCTVQCTYNSKVIQGLNIIWNLSLNELIRYVRIYLKTFIFKQKIHFIYEWRLDDNVHSSLNWNFINRWHTWYANFQKLSMPRLIFSCVYDHTSTFRHNFINDSSFNYYNMYLTFREWGKDEIRKKLRV